MSNYRRLISYIYAYEGGIKGKNIGFAKIEARNGQCKIQVNVKKIYVGNSDLGVYLLAGSDQILLGKIFVRNGAGEFRASVSVQDVERTGWSMEECFGLTIHSVEDSWRAYTTIWEDAVTQAAQLRSGQKEDSDAVAHAAEVDLGEVTAECLEVEAMMQVPDTIAPDESGPENGISHKSSIVEEIEADIQAQSREEEKQKQNMDEGEPATEIPEKSADRTILRPCGMNETKESKETSETNEVFSKPQGGDIQLEGTSAQSVSPKAAAEAGSVSASGAVMPSGAAVPSGTVMPSGAAVPSVSASPSASEPSPSFVPEPSHVPPAPVPPPGMRPGMAAAQPRNRSLGIAEAPMPEMEMGSDISGLSGQEPGQYQEMGVCNSAAPAPCMRSGQYPVWSSGMAPGQPPTRGCGKVPGQPPAGEYGKVPGQSPAGAYGKIPGQSSVWSYGPASGQQPTQPTNMTLSQPPTQPTSMAPVQQPVQPAVPPERESEVEDRKLLELLEQEEMEARRPVCLWQHFRKTHPKIEAFDYANGCEILTIKPQDIGLLPRETWTYGNNSFVLHGYYSYRYLILVKLNNPNGEPRYLMGVPGHYYSNEKYMASMFGFPNFVLSKQQPEGDVRFGYWYTDINMGNQ